MPVLKDNTLIPLPDHFRLSFIKFLGWMIFLRTEVSKLQRGVFHRFHEWKELLEFREYCIVLYYLLDVWVDNKQSEYITSRLILLIISPNQNHWTILLGNELGPCTTSVHSI